MSEHIVINNYKNYKIKNVIYIIRFKLLMTAKKLEKGVLQSIYIFQELQLTEFIIKNTTLSSDTIIIIIREYKYLVVSTLF